MVARERIARRMSAGDSFSEMRPELYEVQRAEEEASTVDLESIKIDTTESYRSTAFEGPESSLGV